jgi:hypothetical protein
MTYYDLMAARRESFRTTIFQWLSKDGNHVARFWWYWNHDIVDFYFKSSFPALVYDCNPLCAISMW